MSGGFQGSTAVRPAIDGSLSGLSERSLNEDQAKVEEIKARAYLDYTKAEDQRTLTSLKEMFAGSIMFFMWMWFGALTLAVMTYFASQLSLNREIPKEVIIAIFTTTAVIVGLVGYILKGLFGAKD